MTIPLIVLLIVLALIAVRQIGRLRLQIWQIMLFGAAAVLATLQISPLDALKAVNVDVMLFLFGMFVVGRALEESGYLAHLSYAFFKRARSVDALILFVLFGMGGASAFLMNDTLAIIGTPVALLLARQHAVNPKILLLALAFAVTIGSVMSPIGNPQNLLIAIDGGVPNPFVTFFKYLLIPTVINLFLAYAVLRIFYRAHFHAEPLNHARQPITDPKLAALSRVSLVVIMALVAAKIVIAVANIPFDLRLTYIALAAALPILAFSPRRFEIARKIDWHTLVFFASMFILMQCVWQSGFFQSAIDSMKRDITAPSMIIAVSVVMSQLISNVPLVALYLPVLLGAGAATREMIALAAGSTIAGNLSILGAASNVIVIQNAEKRTGDTLTFFEFARIGIPLTAINAAVYWLFLRIL